jgi:hypothetical protein
MDDRRPGAMTDETLDRELAAAFAVEHSPEFLARVRSRVAGETARPAIGSWMFASATAIIAIAVAVLVIATRSATTVVPSVVGRDIALAGIPAVPPIVDPATVPRIAEPSRPRQSKRASASPAVNEGGHVVLISQDEQRAFALLVRTIEDGRLSPAAGLSAAPGEPVLESIQIPPLDTTPLPDIPQLEGGLP